MWNSCRTVTCLERFDVLNQSTLINVTRFRPAQPEDVTLEAALLMRLFVCAALELIAYTQEKSLFSRSKGIL